MQLSGRFRLSLRLSVTRGRPSGRRYVRLSVASRRLCKPSGRWRVRLSVTSGRPSLNAIWTSWRTGKIIYNSLYSIYTKSSGNRMRKFLYPLAQFISLA